MAAVIARASMIRYSIGRSEGLVARVSREPPLTLTLSPPSRGEGNRVLATPAVAVLAMLCPLSPRRRGEG